MVTDAHTPVLPLASPPPPGRLAQRVWWLPLLLALCFVLAVAAWLEWTDRQDLENERSALITDALTLDSRIGARVATEQAAVSALAARLPLGIPASALLGHAVVAEGLRGTWVGVTVLDANNRLTLQLPDPAPVAGAGRATARGLHEPGVSVHLAAPLASGQGRLVVRMSPTSLLQATVPWWLLSRYQVRLVDRLDQVIAQSADWRPLPGHDSHRVSVEPVLNDTYLELTLRTVHKRWWRTLPMLMMVVFLLTMTLVTWLLRRQMREVARAELSWRTETAWRRAIEDSLTVGLRGRDMDGRLVHVNRAFCDLVGFTPQQLLGRLPPMPYWPADEVQESMSRHLRNMAGAAPREGYETRWLRADGQSIDVVMMEAPLVDAAGRQVGWMGSVVDITLRKRLEEREQRQTETLAHQARLTTLGEVASVLAHQLNQPLTAVAGYNAGVLTLLERSGQADPVVVGALRSLGEQASEAGRIVQRIREFLTRRSPQRERCDPAALARRAVALLQRDLSRHQAQLDWDLDPALPAVLADPVLVEQVLINLIRNALDEALPAGREGRRLRVAASRTGVHFVRVDVDDNGPGLQGRSIEQLTAPFYSTKAEGMGMGLAICRSVIELHHGALDVGTGSLAGARFSFTLPVDVPVAAGAAAAASSPEGRHAP
jgi:two-component system sensor histidine kinase DctS